jgi:hypothetical protein
MSFIKKIVNLVYVLVCVFGFGFSCKAVRQEWSPESLIGASPETQTWIMDTHKEIVTIYENHNGSDAFNAALRALNISQEKVQNTGNDGDIRAFLYSVGYWKLSNTEIMVNTHICTFLGKSKSNINDHFHRNNYDTPKSPLTPNAAAFLQRYFGQEFYQIRQWTSRICHIDFNAVISALLQIPSPCHSPEIPFPDGPFSETPLIVNPLPENPLPQSPSPDPSEDPSFEDPNWA